MTLFQLGLACYYAFLFKLTNGQQDLCVVSVNANRYRYEIQDIIGMFVSTVPYRQQIDPTLSFDHFVHEVQKTCLEILSHSHYPLQNIIEDVRAGATLTNFEAMFNFIDLESIPKLYFGTAELVAIEEVDLQYFVAVELDEQYLTYGEMLTAATGLAHNLLDKFHIQLGEVICQCVERSIEMVIGIIAIEILGGVYCPLSPDDPQKRLQQLVFDVSGRLVLMHSMTPGKIDDVHISYIDELIVTNTQVDDVDVECLSSTRLTSNDLAYILFTSGSTGTPKASIPLGETGQLYVGGAGVFAGYLGRDDLTSQVLLSVDGNIFYKTGDL
ncbi:unnamed protein product, partial [Rotaria sp. Silwood1]